MRGPVTLPKHSRDAILAFLFRAKRLGSAMHLRIGFLTRPFTIFVADPMHEKEANEAEAKPHFRPRWSDRVFQSQR
jgi:hypothetical protein